MAKVMLVEDDNNLREIYEARLAAEGYQIVSARDGEEALALAVKEKPELIIADIMMPKVSGFDMLDILRSTAETKHAKIIMMTALSQAEDKARAEKLGADRYLVKSQVTLEDVVRVARELLDESEVAAPTQIAGAEATNPSPAPVDPAKTSTSLSANIPVAAAPTAPEPPVAAPAPEPTPPTPVIPEPPAPPTQPASGPAASEPSKPTPITITTPDDTPAAAPATPEPPAPTPAAAESTAKPEPLTAAKPDDKPAEAPAPPAAPSAGSAAAEQAEKLSETTSTEEKNLEAKIEDFIANNPTLTTSAEPEKDKAAAEAKKAEEKKEAKPEDKKPAEDKADGHDKESAEPDAKKEEDKKTPESPDKPDTDKKEDTKKPAEEDSDADKTMDNAKEKLGVKDEDEKKDSPKKTENTSDINDDSMHHKKVIEPLSDFKTGGPNIDELLAKEGDIDSSSESGVPPVNAVITPDGATLGAAEPGMVSPTPPQPGTDIKPSGTPPSDANNIAL